MIPQPPGTAVRVGERIFRLNLVARLVAVAVVDRLEVVDVGDHKGDVRAEPPAVVDLVVQAFIERAPVGQIRQGVGLRLPREACQIGQDARNGTG